MPDGAGYHEYQWNPAPGVQWQGLTENQGESMENASGKLFLDPTNNINAHRVNLNRHYVDPTAAARRLYRSTPGRLTKKLHIDVETNQLRPDGIPMPPLHVLEHDPRQYIMMRDPKNADISEQVSYSKKDGVMPRGAGPWNGAEAYRPYQRVDIYRNPIPLAETGEKIPFGRWGNPGPGEGYYGMKETLDEAQRVIQDDRRVRGYNLEKELAFYQQNNNRIRGFNVPDPFNIQQKSRDSAASRPLNLH